MSINNDIDHLYNHPNIYDFDLKSLDRHDIDFWQNCGISGKVIELGSGTGRLSALWLKNGCQVTGVESAAAMIRACHSYLDEQKLSDRFTLLHQDMTAFKAAEKADNIVIAFNTFNHLVTPREQLACLLSCRHNLKPGGRLFVDVFNPLVWAPWDSFRLSRSFELNGVTWERHEKHLTSHGTQQFVVELKFINTKTDETTHVGVPLRTVWRYEMQWLLQQTGFNVKHVYGHYNKNLFDGYNANMIFVATKQSQ